MNHLMDDLTSRGPVSKNRMMTGVVPHTRPGPLEMALEKAWSQFEHQSMEPRRLWQRFLLGRRFHLRFLDRSEMTIEVPFGTLPDCNNCVELCCTGPNAIVSLRLKDIAVLVDAGLGSYIHRSKETKLEILQNTHAASLARDSIFYSAFPTLQRDHTGTCALLGPQLKCSVFPNWPLSCARYPYALDSENRVIFLAKGCSSHRRISVDDAPDSIQKLVQASIDCYNERIKDILLLHLALDNLNELGFLRYLNLSPQFLKKHLKGTPA